MTRSVLIGRSVKQAGPMVEEIAKRGIRGVYQALLQVERLPPPDDFEDRLAAAQAVIVTSANAAIQLAQFTRKRFVPILAVGDGTTARAHALGFGDVVSAQGDASDLLALCQKRLNPRAGPVLYLRGRNVATDLQSPMQQAGFDIDPIIGYATELVTQFRPRVEQQLRQASLEATILFSPRGAANFVSLVRQAGFEYACAGMTLIAFGPAVAKAATADLVWRLQLVPEKPTIPALLTTLEQWRDGKFAG